VVAAQALPRSTEAEKAERAARLEAALLAASDAPLETARHALEVLRESRRALALGNRHLASDLGCAAELAAAALAAAAYNVRANAILPVLSYLGPAAANILVGSFVVEKLFAIPGLGTHFVNACLNKDIPLVLGVVLTYTAVVVVWRPFSLATDTSAVGNFNPG
jgi:hypothetical protein